MWKQFTEDLFEPMPTRRLQFSQGALSSEIEALEHEFGCKCPQQLRELWTECNGISQLFYSDYDGVYQHDIWLVSPVQRVIEDTRVLREIADETNPIHNCLIFSSTGGPSYFAFFAIGKSAFDIVEWVPLEDEVDKVADDLKEFLSGRAQELL